ncbi:tetracycline resistance protein, TetA/multidrug resistance protein MdtG [Kipferlia bialata]|uniref:Tetracycline resistance protein, TetA/multidrug resistance protein MdtG n=1 Tax=Kipferlia bialata TaxID=797122 RepID=A0A9K3D159_9EUKA|nr:tetracycline resistance protein, TetA/multidrug resistance protein MdtG [Kipferlia bialata]|eukprot:g8075.t1
MIAMKEYITGISDKALLWAGALSIYNITKTLLEMVLGKFSDHHGRAPIVRVCMLISCLGCLVQARSPSVVGVYVARLTLGAGASTSGVLKAAINDVCPHDMRTKVNGKIGATTVIGSVLGPVAGLVLDAENPGNDLRLASVVTLGLYALCLLSALLCQIESAPVIYLTEINAELRAIQQSDERSLEQNRLRRRYWRILLESGRRYKEKHKDEKTIKTMFQGVKAVVKRHPSIQKLGVAYLLSSLTLSGTI